MEVDVPTPQDREDASKFARKAAFGTDTGLRRLLGLTFDEARRQVAECGIPIRILFSGPAATENITVGLRLAGGEEVRSPTMTTALETPLYVTLASYRRDGREISAAYEAHGD